MLIGKKHLSRRTFLRGAAGVGIGLPLLDAMIPAALAQPSNAVPTRYGFVYTPHGYKDGARLPLGGAELQFVDSATLSS